MKEWAASEEGKAFVSVLQTVAVELTGDPEAGNQKTVTERSLME